MGATDEVVCEERELRGGDDSSVQLTEKFVVSVD